MGIAIAASAAALALLYLGSAGAAVAGLIRLDYLPFLPGEVVSLAIVLWASTGFFLALTAAWLFRRSGGGGARLPTREP